MKLASELTRVELNEAAAVEVMTWSDNPGYKSKFYFSSEWSAEVQKADWAPAIDNAQALRVFLRALEIIGDQVEAVISFVGCGHVDACVGEYRRNAGGVHFLAATDYKPVAQLAEVLTRTAVAAVRNWRLKQQATTTQ
jgi:hypothetical protein